MSVVLHRHERELEARDVRSGTTLGRIRAGVGPTNVATDGDNLAYVVDTAGEALLVVRLRPRLEITRRVHLPGSPYGIAVDRVRGRLWVTATRTNGLVRLTAGARPRAVAAFPTVRQPDRVVVDEANGSVWVIGDEVRRLDAP